MVLKNFLFKYRSYTPIPLALIILYNSQLKFPDAIYGLTLILFGELFRISAVRYAGGITRTRDVGAKKLCSSGPYARTRNPLYIGNIIIYCGFALFAGGENVLIILIAVILFFSFQYWMIIELEEKTLFTIFKDEYVHYTQNVPRFIPQLRYWDGLGHRNPMGIFKTISTEKRTLQNIFLFSSLIIIKSFWKF